MPQYNGVWTLQAQSQAQSNQQWVTDPNFKNTTLLLQADNAANGAQNNTFLDSSSLAGAITRTGNTTQGSLTPFSQAPGYWSNYLTSSNYLSVTSSASLASGTSSFTLEFWYNSGATGNGRPMGNGAGAAYGANNWVFGSNNTSGKLELFVYNYNTSTAMLSSTSSSVASDNQWHHIAIVRSTNTWAMFIDGVRQGSTVTSAVSFNGTSSGITIGFSGISGETATAFVGYLSNVRFVNGSAIYDPTQTVISVPSSTLTPVTNTVLLTCQSNAFVDTNTQVAAKTILVTGTPSVQPFGPFAPQYQWTAPVIGGSAYFDGTGDYLTVADNASLEPGSGNFTLECWFYATATPPTYGATILAKSATSSYGPFLIIIDPTTRYLYGYASSTGSSWNIVCNNSTVTALNTWYHVALVRSGSNFALFVNGARAPTTATSSATLINNTDPFAIGYANYSSTVFCGYISSVRYVVGTALYDPTLTTCTIPTAPLTAVTNTQLLCNFTNAGIYDGTMKNVLETVGNAQVVTSPVKYGSGSMYFDGTGDYLPLNASPNLALLAGDFTVEMWVYPTSYSAATNYPLWDTRGSATSTAGYYFGLSQTNGYPIVYLYPSTILTGTFGPALNTWSHVAFSRVNGTIRAFVNGVQCGSVANSNSITDPSAYVTRIGQSAVGGAENYTGYIDDFRITKGVGRYTANFTPPQVALPRQ